MNELSDVNPLLGIKEIVLKKEISMRFQLTGQKEHYDREDRNGVKLGEADGNLVQFPSTFVVKGYQWLVDAYWRQDFLSSKAVLIL